MYFYWFLEESMACETALSKYIEKDVSGDKRYKKRYLEFLDCQNIMNLSWMRYFYVWINWEHAFEFFRFYTGLSTQKY